MMRTRFLPTGRVSAVLSAILLASGLLGACSSEPERAAIADDWSDEERDLLSAVARQVSQHVENLRLLEQAEQYRDEAEQATRRLTLEGWEEYLTSEEAPSSGYVYDLKRVSSYDPNEDISFAGETGTFSQNLKVRDEDIGQIVVADPDRDQETVANLMSIIAERLSVQIENLRLLDETETSRQQLDRRAAELETVAQVSTAAATIHEPQALLQSVVDLTRYSFSLYHSSVYLLNDTGDTLTVEIVGVEKKSFPTGEHYWRTVAPGTYTIRAWACGGSGEWQWALETGRNTLRFFCESSASTNTWLPFARSRPQGSIPRR